MVIEMIQGAVSNGFERATAPFKETQVGRARKVLAITRDLMTGVPGLPDARMDTYLDGRSARLARALYRLTRALPSHNETTDRTERGLASFIGFQLIARRANVENLPDIVHVAQKEMYNSRLLPLRPIEGSTFVGGEPVPGSNQAFQERAGYLAQRLSALSGLSEDQQGQAYTTICRDLEEAVVELSSEFPHTPRK